MRLSRLPMMLDLGGYGQSNKQVSPRTDGYIYRGLGQVHPDSGVRGLQIGHAFFLVHITIPKAEADVYPAKHQVADEAHAKHFHITLCDPRSGDSLHHFHYLTNRKEGGVVRPVTGITFRAQPNGRLLDGSSAWNSQIFTDGTDDLTDEQAERSRRWRVMQIDLLATAFLATVKP
jgi:hypothetical protein